MFRSLWLGIFCISWLFPGLAFGALTVTYNDTIPRDVADRSFFDLEFNIQDIIPEANQPEEFYGRMKFFLPKESAIAGGEITNESARYRIEQIDTPTSEESDVQTTNSQGKRNFNGTVKARVFARTASFSELVEEGQYIQFRVEYKDTKNNQDFRGETKKLSLLVHVPKAAPELSTQAAHKRITALFTTQSTVQYTDDKERAPNGVTIYAIPLELDGTVLASYRHEPGEKSDVAGDFCTYNQLENGGDCITCQEEGQTDKNFYLDTDKIKQIDGVVVLGTTRNGSGKLSISGLNPGQKYAIFATYEPDGVARSSCVVAEPGLNYSLSELNFEDEAKQQTAQCFIATAAYGTPMHRRIDELRWFRDTYLKTTRVGRAFVDTYYKFAPPLAEIVAKRPWLQSTVRWILDPLTSLIERHRAGVESSAGGPKSHDS
jgi:hypothetical protein